MAELRIVEDVAGLFGFDVRWPVHGFAKKSEHVPALDTAFCFDEPTTKALLLGFSCNRRVYVHGPHGSGKSTHIEQVATRLNWPCVRVNLDGHVTRSDLIGRDVITVKDGHQVTEFLPGILVWALEHPVAIVLDEYDAGRPDVMFVIQRVLESQGRLTLLEQNRVIEPHPYFRLFATANTAGQGDATGLYAGTQVLNQAQMDRWQVVTELGHLPPEKEIAILHSRVKSLDAGIAQRMVSLATLCRQSFRVGDLSTLMSLRTLITWAENFALVEDVGEALLLSFVNRCDDTEHPLLAEFFQRCFNQELAVGTSFSHVY